MSKRFSVAPASSLRMAFEQDKHTALLKHRRGLVASDVQGLQRITHDAIGALIGFSEGRVEAEETMAALLGAIGALAWQRENVSKANQPELDLEVSA